MGTGLESRWENIRWKKCWVREMSQHLIANIFAHSYILARRAKLLAMQAKMSAERAKILAKQNKNII